MGLKGYTFDRMKISPKADALLYHSMLDGNDRIVKGYKEELKVVATGLNTYVSPGACVVQGRMIEIDEEMQLSVSANDSGYVCIVIDLTQNNTSTGEAGTPDYQPVNNQIRLEVVKGLVQQDLHDGGQLYTFPLASFTSTGTTVALTKINHNQRIVESGSNVHGSWTKFADGTMICHQKTNLQSSNFIRTTRDNSGLNIKKYARTYTYPQSFSGEPTVIHSGAVADNDVALSTGVYGVNKQNATIYFTSLIDQIDMTSDILAIGRWK